MNILDHETKNEASQFMSSSDVIKRPASVEGMESSLSISTLNNPYENISM